MDSSRRGLLSPLQWEVLRGFFSRERSFWLTGGAALAGFHLEHRRTGDLDLFTSDPLGFERGAPVLGDLSAELGLGLEVVQDAPGFKRFAVTAADNAVVVDLVLERVPQLHPEKPEIDGILVDPPEEILANKLTTLVGRMEERDLVDVMFLERRGLRAEELLDMARLKDGGCTPATLSWLLSEVEIPPGASLPGGVAADEVREWLAGFVERMRGAAFPG